MDLQIVTHCWSGPDVPIYHKLLKLQLCNLLHASERANVSVSLVVVWTISDLPTSKVVSQVQWLDNKHLDIVSMPLDPEELFVRAIGRNMAAKQTKAEVVWFTDCDYLFSSGALEQAVEQMRANPQADLIWPNNVMIHADHAIGDAFLQTEYDLREKEGWKPLEIKDAYDAGFRLRREKRAIGGMQIVRGDWCRKNGYLDQTGWVNPSYKEHFQQCRCDVPFRRQFVGDTKISTDIEYVYRVRHSRAGRDRGEKDHSR